MLKSKMRLLGVSALVGAGLIAAGPADAYNVRLGGVDIQIDTTLSVGASMKVGDYNTNHLSLGNGGNIDNRPVVDLLTAAGTIKGGGTAAQAMTAASKGTVSNMDDSCGTSYTQICLTVGPSEAATLNGLRGSAAPAFSGDEAAVGGGPNYDASINGDDARLNFEDGDLLGATTKVLAEVEASNGPIRAFARVSAFYDAVLGDEDNFARSAPLDAADDEMVSDLDLLDFYIDYEGDLLDMPYMVRVGKQVINWGESTFFLGGNSVFNAIDVAALRRPGAEIKDALLPVEAAYFSISPTDALTLEAYYGGHKKFQLDVSGSPFANSDALVPGSGEGGNNGFFLVGGSPTSGSNALNCDEDGVTAATAMNIYHGTKAVQDALNDTAGVKASWADCVDTGPLHYANGAPVGEIESYRELRDDTNRIELLADEVNGDDTYGVALRYYAENLNSTEFGFYYQNYTSRIPYIGYRAGTPAIGIGTTGGTASQVTLGLQGTAACDRNTFGLAINPHAAAMTSDVMAGITIGDAGDDILDTYGAWGALKAAAASEFTRQSALTMNRTVVNDAVTALQAAFGAASATAAASSILANYHGQISVTQQAAANPLVGSLTAASHAAATEAKISSYGLSSAAKAVLATDADEDGTPDLVALGVLTADRLGELTSAGGGGDDDYEFVAGDVSHGTVSGAAWWMGALQLQAAPSGDTFKDLMDVQCILGAGQRMADSTDANWYGDFGANGSMQAAINYDTDLFAYYPEDIEVYGVSFATTLAGWGVQGEVTARPDFPLLVDTDSTFIAAAVTQCTLPLIGDAGMAVYAPLVTRAGYICDSTVGNQTLYSHENMDVYNWDIGTTATFTRSNPVISFLRADIGVLLTEFGGVIVPDLEDTYFGAQGTSQIIDRLQSICTAGSDLPLGGLLDLDAVPANSCRPTETSTGGLIFASLQYNNVFGTAWGLSPRIIVREGLDGYSPSPAGSFREGVGSSSFSLTGTYQDVVVSLSYTDFTGDEKYSKSEDQDYASFSVNYAF